MDDTSSARSMILRAWKDEGYRRSLPGNVRDEIPPRPEGFNQLSDDELEQAAGAGSPLIVAGVALAGAAGFGAGYYTVDKLAE